MLRRGKIPKSYPPPPTARVTLFALDEANLPK